MLIPWGNGRPVLRSWLIMSSRSSSKVPSISARARSQAVPPVDAVPGEEPSRAGYAPAALPEVELASREPECDIVTVLFAIEAVNLVVG